MSENQYRTMKAVIERLLQDAKRVQQLEPNAATAASILDATLAIKPRLISTGNHRILENS